MESGESMGRNQWDVDAYVAFSLTRALYAGTREVMNTIDMRN